MSVVLISSPRIQLVDENGDPLVGAKLYTLQTGTATPVATYTNAALTVAQANPILSDANGFFPAIYPDPDLGALKFRFFDADDVNLGIDTDPAYRPLGVSDLSATSNDVAQLLNSFDRTAAEVSSDVTPSDYSYSPYPYNLARIGLVPNSTAARTANTAALQALLDPTLTGIRGEVIFPNTTGADTYYFNGIIEVRDGIRLNLNGCTLNFSKTYEAADDTMGFLTFIRDVSVENGTIEIDYDGSAGTNAGTGMRIGGRSGYRFGSISSTAFFEDAFTTPMGNIALKNLRLTTNNPDGFAILMLGGLRNVLVENVTVDAQDVADGIYYEFGFYSQNGFPSTTAQWSSSHASEMVFKNVRVENVLSTGAGLSLIGASNALVQNLAVRNAGSCFVFRPGEAFFFRPGGTDFGVVKRCITLVNITGYDISGTGLSLTGAQTNASSYLSDAAMTAAGLAVLTESQKTDLMRFSVDGGIISAAGFGASISGPVDMRNVTLNGAASSGQLVLSDDCMRGVFTNCEFRNSTNVGVRASFGNSIFATPRLKSLEFINCLVAGNVTAGYSFGHTKHVCIRGGRIGYTVLNDGVAETTQTVGVSVDQAILGGGVYCHGVDVATSGGSAYAISGTITNPCGVYTPKGTVTFTGNWEVDGIATATATQLADKTSFINVAGKYANKLCNDSSNSRLMIAQGSTDVATWKTVADFGVGDTVVTVTPA
jgi:hypothetical protein